jgi:hypothetical protein
MCSARVKWVGEMWCLLFRNKALLVSEEKEQTEEIGQSQGRRVEGVEGGLAFQPTRFVT